MEQGKWQNLFLVPPIPSGTDCGQFWGHFETEGRSRGNTNILGTVIAECQGCAISLHYYFCYLPQRLRSHNSYPQLKESLVSHSSHPPPISAEPSKRRL